MNCASLALVRSFTAIFLHRIVKNGWANFIYCECRLLIYGCVSCSLACFTHLYLLGFPTGHREFWQEFNCQFPGHQLPESSAGRRTPFFRSHRARPRNRLRRRSCLGRRRCSCTHFKTVWRSVVCGCVQIDGSGSANVWRELRGWNKRFIEPPAPPE